ncbi:unnamed protein product [Prorocentrum cordatum]|uniref:Uncharacterized protein n=1 Tax=Prorocentrum cordatum TaxID=2364126 RepID=A0ABN9W910_9DINO|nr:unnamed protein product [Polarella glacialis]
MELGRAIELEGASPKASPKAKAAAASGSLKAKAAASGGAADGRRGFPGAPWSSAGSSELDRLLAIPDPIIAAKLREAVAGARDFVPPPPAATQRTLEQQLQSATDRRINLQRQLDEAADALLAVEEQLDECCGWRDTCAASLAEAQAGEAKLLRSRAQASGITPPTPGGSKSATFIFDVESLEDFSELEEEAQANLRQMREEGYRVTLEAQATFDQLQRLKQDIEEAAASKRRKRERPQPDGPAGAPAQGPAAAAAAEQQATPPAAAAAAAAPAAAAEPTSGFRERAVSAAELGAAAAEAAHQRATEQKVAGGHGGSADQGTRGPAGTDPTAAEVQSPVRHTERTPAMVGVLAIRLEQCLPHLQLLALRQGSLEGDLRICTYNGNTWNSIASVHEWMRRKRIEPHVAPFQETRFFPPTAEEQAHGWANRRGLQLACSTTLRTGEAAMAVSSGVGVATSKLLGSARFAQPPAGQQRGPLPRGISLGKGATIAVISVYLEDSVGLQGSNRQLLAVLHEWPPFVIGGCWNIEASELMDSGCWERPAVQTQRAPDAFDLDIVTDDAARGRRDQSALQGMSDDEARIFKGRARGIMAVTAPHEAKVPREAALRLRGEFQDLGVAMLDGYMFDSFWGEVGLQTDMGYNPMAMIEQLATSKQKWGDFNEMAFKRQGPAAHGVSEKTHVEPALVREGGPTGVALVGQPALEMALADWPPPWANPVRTKQGRPRYWGTGEWSLNPITIDDFEQVARKFPRATGSGRDNFHPHLLLEVGGDMLRRLASVLNSWERSPRCGELCLDHHHGSLAPA